MAGSNASNQAAGDCAALDPPWPHPGRGRPALAGRAYQGPAREDLGPQNYPRPAARQRLPCRRGQRSLDRGGSGTRCRSRRHKPRTRRLITQWLPNSPPRWLSFDLSKTRPVRIHPYVRFPGAGDACVATSGSTSRHLAPAPAGPGVTGSATSPVRPYPDNRSVATALLHTEEPMWVSDQGKPSSCVRHRPAAHPRDDGGSGGEADGPADLAHEGRVPPAPGRVPDDLGDRRRCSVRPTSSVRIPGGGPRRERVGTVGAGGVLPQRRALADPMSWDAQGRRESPEHPDCRFAPSW